MLVEVLADEMTDFGTALDPDRFEGWAYRVPEYKASSMTKQMSDLVQPVADGS